MARVAMQASLFATLGLGAYALRRLTHEPLHPIVMEHSNVVARYPSLAAAVSRLHVLQNDEGLRHILEQLSRIAEMDAGRSPAAQWQISRMSGDVARDARAMCRKASESKSEEMFRAVLTCTDEVVPQIEGHLENLLHNHLLAMA